MKSVGILLFIVGIGNFVYQGILTLRKLRKEANEVRTTHRFCCTACGEKYELSTVETNLFVQSVVKKNFRNDCMI